MSALTTPTYSNKREQKRKRNEQKETPTSDRKPNKGKERDHLKKTSLGPLRQGQRLDTSETRQGSSKERKPPNQSSKNHKELPLHTCKLPSTNAPPPGRMHANHLKTGQLQQLYLTPVRPVTTTGQTSAQHVHRTSTRTGQTGDLAGQTGDQQSPEMARNHLKTF
jgi:hypothetical protein